MSLNQKHETRAPIDAAFFNRLSVVQNDHESGDYEAAERGYRELIASQPAIWQLYFNLGMLLFDQRRFEEALTCYLDGCAVNHGSIDLLYNSAICFKELGRFDEAIDSYEKALLLDPDDLDCRYNLAGCYRAQGRERDALITYLDTLDFDPNHVSSLKNAAYLLHKNGEHERARELYQRVLQIDPENPAADHMLAALSGAERGHAPAAYVRDVFDQFADHYDISLTDNLEYRLPSQLYDFYRSLAKKNSIGHLLDLGCGTGLVGECFQLLCCSITGVDISANMVAAARRKQIYTSLHVNEIVSFLEEIVSQDYDLIISADVFPYIGDLAPVLSGASRCARPGGYYLFSVEHDAADSEHPQLQESGRFSHSRVYVENMAQRCGWVFADERIVHLRKERDAWIKGCIYVLLKS